MQKNLCMYVCICVYVLCVDLLMSVESIILLLTKLHPNIVYLEIPLNNEDSMFLIFFSSFSRTAEDGKYTHTRAHRHTRAPNCNGQSESGFRLSGNRVFMSAEKMKVEKVEALEEDFGGRADAVDPSCSSSSAPPSQVVWSYGWSCPVPFSSSFSSSSSSFDREIPVCHWLWSSSSSSLFPNCSYFPEL